MLLLLPLGAAAAGPAVGDRLPSFQLPAPDSAAARTDLGVAADTTFDPAAIDGRLLLIEIFSMYCPHCQREAPAVNRLYQAVTASPALGAKVRVIGIGVGNSPYEVDLFRKHYEIAFPLFADEDFAIHRLLGEVRTPFFILVDLSAANRGRIVWTGAGKLEATDSVVAMLTSLMPR